MQHQHKTVKVRKCQHQTALYSPSSAIGPHHTVQVLAHSPPPSTSSQLAAGGYLFFDEPPQPSTLAGSRIGHPAPFPLFMSGGKVSYYMRMALWRSLCSLLYITHDISYQWDCGFKSTVKRQNRVSQQIVNYRVKCPASEGEKKTVTGAGAVSLVPARFNT